jgi:hypothetical protein
MVNSTGRAMPGSVHSRWRTSSNIIAPTITRMGAVAALGMIPASGEMNRQQRNSAPVMTDARPVRAPSPIPAELSMNVVFDDAEAAPPAAAATESTSSTRRMPGSRPSWVTRPARRPRPRTVPAVSKKSDSSTDSTIASALQKPSAEMKFSEKSPTRPKFGASTTLSGHVAVPLGKTFWSLISLMTVATSVVPRIPNSNAPGTRRATSA